jgi:hypothetical protein
MRVLFVFFFIVHFSFLLKSQREYFQQEVTNIIEVSLDDKNHILQAKIEIKYKNNSPDILDKIPFHIWPNAYSNKNTAFAKQKLLHRSTKFYDAKLESLGSLDSYEFQVDGALATVQKHKVHSDIVYLILPKPLKPGESIVIKTPFSVKLPDSYSRLGHVGESYQITQWYPKPAVYDHKGWHEFPYLDQGEFYSEFGDYDVKITLPKNYVVGATGAIQDQSEIDFLQSMHDKTSESIKTSTPLFTTVPVSVSELKTLHFKAENVHDFAWFADKTFMVQKSQVKLKSGKLVDTYAMFTKLGVWNDAVNYVSRSIAFYSEHVGDYPWPQATAVHSALSAGGGMEYPMITVIGDADTPKSLDDVITHEVGHNWFYGILASNEREHPFMDEGLNTYYENRYLKTYYNDESRFIPENISKFLKSEYSEKELVYLLSARSFIDQYPNQHSSNFTAINYGTDVYMKTANLFEFLEKSLGTDLFDETMKTYYETWKFRHPYPENLENIFNAKVGTKADWLFDYFLTTNKKVDYKLCKYHHTNEQSELTLVNKEKIPSPVKISGLKDDKIVFEQWVDGFVGKQKIKIPNSVIDKLVIDKDNVSFDLRRHNNQMRTSGLFKKIEPLKINFLPILDNPLKTEIGILPVIGWNAYDRTMIGVHLCQPFLPAKNFNLEITPLYSFGTKSLVGMAKTSYTKYFEDGLLHHIKLNLFGKTFGFEKVNVGGEILKYRQVTPSVVFELRKKPATMKSSNVTYKFYWIQDDYVDYVDTLQLIRKVENTVHQLYYGYQDPNILGRTKLKTGLQYQAYKDVLGVAQSYIRADLDYRKSYRYMKNRYFDARFFGSMFLYNTERESVSIATRRDYSFTQGSVGLAYQPYSDLTNEELFLGRTLESGLWSQQIAVQNGGFKLAHGITQANNLGNTNILLASINLSSDLPFKYVGNIIRPYFDLGFYEPNQTTDSKVLMSGGINIKFPLDIINIYFPLYHSKNISDLYKSIDHYSYAKEIVFSLRLKIPSLNDILSSTSF